MSLRRIAANGGLIAASIVVCLALFELGLRWIDPPSGAEPVTDDQYEFYRFDPVLGWANAPNARGVFARRDFSYDLRINSHGLRGPEIDIRKPAGIRRIAVLGDSFVWGVGASDAELFPTLIEQAIPGSQVLNFGVSGYGPLQYHLLTDRVLQFDPDVVVVAFCLGNDFVDNVLWQRYRYYKPFAALDERGELIVGGYPLPNVRRFRAAPGNPLMRWVYDNSRLVQLVNEAVVVRLFRLDDFGQRGPKFAENQSDLYRNPDSAVSRQVEAVNRKLFEKITAAYAGRGIQVVVLAVPTKCEFGRCYRDPTPVDGARLALARSLQNLPVTLIDPTPNFSIDDFWEHDGHWRPVGHRKAADAVVPAIKRLLTDRGP